MRSCNHAERIAIHVPLYASAGADGADGTNGAVFLSGGGPIDGAFDNSRFMPVGAFDSAVDDVDVAVPLPLNGSLHSFFVALASAPGSDMSVEFEVYVNGNGTGLYCWMSGNNTQCNGGETSVLVSAGDTVSVRSFTSDAVITNAKFSMVLEPSPAS